MSLHKEIALESEICAHFSVAAQRAIDFIQKRRTALISAAVTGKIDVRQPATG